MRLLHYFVVLHNFQNRIFRSISQMLKQHQLYLSYLENLHKGEQKEDE